ncbi:MAG: molecular chaperone [Deltaproteobacteria bacterium]|nr:molecular chaperone [Deltaproteobacteria bacterium]MCW5809111.1 molecular chaperone [Deltaproteobacteria bacterium]
MRTPLIACAALAFSALGAADAAADRRFQVEPTRLSLSTEAPAGALVLANQGTEPLRLQVAAYRWSEDADGAMRLEPAPEIVVRPAIVEIEAGRARTLRVGTTATSGAVEGTYRVFVEELPDRRPRAASQVQVLTRIGVPVFVVPQRPSIRLAARPDGPGVIAVRNSGTAHVKLARVGLAAVRGSEARWRHEAAGWYVLPGAERRFRVDVGRDACEASDLLAITLVDEDGRSTTSSVPCGR